MLNCTSLLCGKYNRGDGLRYAKDKPADSLRPIVVWNMTRRCNLSCCHCYLDAGNGGGNNQRELSAAEARAMIDDLADFGVPVLLFSGGEPFLREDLWQLGAYAKGKGLRTAISTNGTLIDKHTALKIKDAGFSYVGVSLDGLKQRHDSFRGRAGAFEQALQGIRNCRDSGVRVGVRFTINRYNFCDIGKVLDLVVAEGIPRVCFYHLVYSGRGSAMVDDDLNHGQARQVMDLIFGYARRLCSRDIEILTVDNHADGAYLYLRLMQEDRRQAEEVLRLLRINGGNKSGVGIADIDEQGFVHCDQFWRHHSLGNLRQQRFSRIWSDDSNPLLNKLRDRLKFLRGKCGRCRFQDICAGNFRVRAEAVYGDIWQEDPACYLEEEDIA